ncbi:CDT1-like protein a, chloroplastic [Canna indica]|uniref:CDT1-like protein a, chloroplastic n=1 Tax=Canna indica TaxID=4628 RepID=A0AAQ3Q508_9LILI|nr:CDT1-like protein a, chloroplastic [Canna indica]
MEHESSMNGTPTKFAFSKMVNEKDSDAEACQEMRIDEKQEDGSSFVTPTPEKPEWSSKARQIPSLRKQLAEDFNNEELTKRKTDGSDELPEKYQVLAEFFARLDTSIRLLGLRKLPPTFCNICKQVEVLTKRKFLYSHLAQMNYIFPEAIQIEKVLVHDKESLLVIPDMKITLLKDILEHISESTQSASIALCEAFHARILNFFVTHPEGTDIPEAILPEPFNQGSHNLPLEILPDNSSMDSPHISEEPEELLNASLLPSSFKRQFSQKDIIPEKDRTQLLAPQASPMLMSSCDDAKENISSDLAMPAGMTSNSKSCMASQNVGSTPVKGAPSDSSEMTASTPVQKTPTRPAPTPNEKLTSENEGLVGSEVRLTTSARRSLLYSPTNMEGTGYDTIVSTTQQCSVAKYSSDRAASVKKCLWEVKIGGSPADQSVMEPSATAANFEDVKLNQKGDRKRYEMLACLPATFDAICFSRSTKSLLVTKEELLHKILSNNLEIECIEEAEEHLSLLESLLPDWICKMASSNGQSLYSINQTSDPETYRARLVEAV